MALVYKATLLFGFTPQSNLAGAVGPPRSAGWSESLWLSGPFNQPNFQAWANGRCLVMATDCAVVGARLTPYTYTGNKLIPGHAQVFIVNANGVLSGYTNSPDDTLRVQCTAGAIPTVFPVLLRGVPDSFIESGQFFEEWTGANPYRSILRLIGNIAPAPGISVLWLGRSPVPVSQRVLAVNGALGTIKTQATLGVAANADFIRLKRVYDDNGLPIKGSFLCTAILANADGSFTYTCSGMPLQSRTTSSGTARQDIIATSPVTDATIKELGSRKAGRPFFLFRGRRTKQRV